MNALTALNSTLASFEAPDTFALRAAALHAARGVIPDRDVAVGEHDLAGVDVVISFDRGCSVVRGVGSSGEGLDEYTATSKGLSLAAVMLFLSRMGAAGAGTKGAWKAAIRDAIVMGDKVSDHLPPTVATALAEVQAELASDPALKSLRKTPARRLGMVGACVRVDLPWEASR